MTARPRESANRLRNQPFTAKSDIPLQDFKPRCPPRVTRSPRPRALVWGVRPGPGCNPSRRPLGRDGVRPGVAEFLEPGKAAVTVAMASLIPRPRGARPPATNPLACVTRCRPSVGRSQRAASWNMARVRAKREVRPERRPAVVQSIYNFAKGNDAYYISNHIRADTTSPRSFANVPFGFC